MYAKIHTNSSKSDWDVPNQSSGPTDQRRHKKTHFFAILNFLCNVTFY